MKTSTALAIVIPVLLAGGGVVFYLATKKEEEEPAAYAAPLTGAGGGGGGGGLFGIADQFLGPGTGAALGVVTSEVGGAVAGMGGKAVAGLGKETANAFKPIKDVITSDFAKVAYKQALTGGLYVPAKAAVATGKAVKSGAKKAAKKVKGWFS